MDCPSVEKTIEELGIGRHPPPANDQEYIWNYTSLRDPPYSNAHGAQWAASIYRGLVPSKNINRRDFAINGAVVRILHPAVNHTFHAWLSLRQIMDIALKSWPTGYLRTSLGTR